MNTSAQSCTFLLVHIRTVTHLSSFLQCDQSPSVRIVAVVTRCCYINKPPLAVWKEGAEERSIVFTRSIRRFLAPYHIINVYSSKTTYCFRSSSFDFHYFSREKQNMQTLLSPFVTFLRWIALRKKERGREDQYPDITK